MFGLQCDRTGPTQTVGIVLCPGYHDYIALVNSKGGVEGYKIQVIEIDNEYKVPPAMEAHERFKKEGAVLEGLYGTPQTAALNKKLEEDKILGTSPGFGTAAAADGKRYPYIFPIAASYWSQAARRGRVRQGEAGRQPEGQEDRLPVLRQPGRQGAAADPRGSRQERRLRAAHLRGAGAGRRDGRAGARHHRPLQARLRHHPPVRPRAVGLDQGAEGQGLSAQQGGRASCGAAPEADIKAAGGMGVAEGYHTIQFAGVGNDFQVHQGHRGDVQGAGQAGAEGDGDRPSTTTAAS